MATGGVSGEVVNGREKLGLVRLWDVSDGQQRLISALFVDPAGDHGGIRSVAFSPDRRDGVLLAAMDISSGLHVWNTNNLEKERTEFYRKAPDQGRYSGRFTGFQPGWEDARHRRDTLEVILLDVDTGQVQHGGDNILGEHRNDLEGTIPYRLAFSPDSRLLAVATSVGRSNTILIWSRHSAKVIKVLECEGVMALAFQPRSETLVTASGKRDGDSKRIDIAIKSWDVATWREKAVHGEAPPMWGSSGSPRHSAQTAGSSRFSGRGGNLTLLDVMTGGGNRYFTVRCPIRFRAIQPGGVSSW